MIFITFFTFAQDRTASASGDWNDTATWGGSSVPNSTQNVAIDSGVLLTVNVSAACNSIDASSGSFLQIDEQLTITGNSANSVFGGITNVAANLTITAGNFTNNGDFTVSPGKQVIFSSSSSTITNSDDIKLNSTSELYSSLLYKGSSVTNTGSISYDRYVSDASTSWDHIGSPLSGQAASGIVGQGDLADNGSQFGIGTFDNTTGADGTWTFFTSANAFAHGDMISGKGYIMGTDNGSSILFEGDIVTASFSINITEGDSQGDVASVTGSRWNLLGNPFTSYISVNSAAAGASSFGSDHLMKSSNLTALHSNNQAIYVNNGSGYTTLTNLTSAENAVLAPGQGFFVGGKHGDTGTDNDFNLNTSMITEDGSDDGISGFNNGISADTNDPDRAELFLSYNQNDLIRTEIYFVEDSNVTNGYDPSYDAEIFSYENNPVYTRLISEDNGVNISVQGIPYSEMLDKVFSLGIHAEAGEETIISISHNTTNPSTYVYLEDALEGTFTNLKETDFVITPDSNLDGVGRFFIHTTASTMSNEDQTTNLLNVFKLDRNNFITVEGLSTESNQTNLKLYNILGKEVISTTLSNNTNTQTISTEGLSTGIYVIKLESGSNLLTKKLIIK